MIRQLIPKLFVLVRIGEKYFDGFCGQ
jgi:hypothetical protein